jgi:hypothetical protein
MEKSMAVGVKETTEALVGVNEVALALVAQFKDGVQLADFTAFYAKLVSDETFKAKVMAAYDGYAKIPEEVKDLDLAEGASLVVVQVGYVPKFVAALHA